MRSPSKPPAAGTRDSASPRADDNSRCFFNNNLWYRRRSAGPMTRPLQIEEILPMVPHSTPTRTPCPQPASVWPPLVLHRRISRFSLTRTTLREQARAGVRRLRRDSRFLVRKQFLRRQAPHRAFRGQNLLGSFLFPRSGPNLLSDVQVCRPRRQRFQATPLKSDSLHARRNIEFLKKENNPCQKITRLSSAVCLKNSGTRAICR